MGHNSPNLTESTTITLSSLSAVPSPLPQELSKLPPSQHQVRNSPEMPSSPDGEELASPHNPSVSEAHQPELVHATETLVAQWSKPMPTESPGLSETPHGEHHHVTPAHTQPSTPRTQLLLTGSNNNCRLILLALFFTIQK